MEIELELFPVSDLAPKGESKTGTTTAALLASREKHSENIARFGEIPESIMVHDKSDKAIDVHANERSYGSTFSNDAFRVRGGGVVAGAISRFPQNIGRKLLLLYTKIGDTVIDPFAGHNSRMELCWRENRHYIGQDVSKTFMEENRAIAAMLEKEKSTDMFGNQFEATITLHEGDSRRLAAESGSGDFTITSPPYWDIEYYGDEVEQLGRGTYGMFLDGLTQVMKENFRCLKRGSFNVWCVNDFRKGGKFYSYHEDTAQRLRSVGFEQHDIAITDLGSSMRACFPNRVIEQKILPKRHEYCLIFKKP